MPWDTTGFKGCAGRETAARVPFRHGNRRDGRIVARPHYASVTVIPMGKPFDILPTKVQARLSRLSRAYAPPVSPFRLHDRRRLPYFTPLREAQGETAVIDRRHASVVRNIDRRALITGYARYIS